MMKNLNKMLCFAFAILVTVSLVGCASNTPNPTESTPAVTEMPTEAPTEATEVTEAPTEEPTEVTEVTEPTEVETEPATEPTDATEAISMQGSSSGQSSGTSNAGSSSNTGSNSGNGNGSSGTSTPAATEPPATQPPATQPPATEAPATTPPATEPDHVHSYTTTVVAATCTSVGYDLHACSCGDDYTDNWTDLAEHNWSGWTITVTATTATEGEQTRTCNSCGKTETEAIPVEVIDTGALEAYARSYAQSLGFSVDTSLTKSNASYYPSLDYPITSMQEGYSFVAGCVSSLYNQLIGGVGTIEGCRYNCLVEYMYTESGVGYYMVYDFYG